MPAYVMRARVSARGNLPAQRERRTVMRQLGDILDHLESFDVLLQSVTVRGDGSVVIVVNGGIPDEQLDHLEIDASEA